LESFCIQKEKDEMYINDGKVSGADFWSIEKANNNGFRYVNIYITSDEEIKEGDYFYSPFLGEERILKYNKFVIPFPKDKKIILTTDQDLIKDGIQPIDDEFLEWFVKNPSCESVSVNKQYITPLGDVVDFCYDNERLNYKIIIPQEEPKQNTCDTIFETAALIEHKQETLEEVKNLEYWRANAEEDYMKVPISVLRYITELERQQERSYSGEEVIELTDWYLDSFLDDALGLNGKEAEKRVEHLKGKGLTKEVMEYWFEQFKKK
jgi:hypothetical protein